MAAFTFDGLNLHSGTPYQLTSVSLGMPEREVITVPLGLNGGGRIVTVSDRPHTVRIAGFIRGASDSAAEASRDALVTVLRRERRLLVLSYQSTTRQWTATCVSFDADRVGPGTFAYRAVFQVDGSPFGQSATPSGDLRTPTLAAMPGSSTAYAATYTLTPGGSARVLPRVVVTNQAGGVTPSLIQLTNLSAGPIEAAIEYDALAAGEALLIDPAWGLYRGSMSSVLGAYAFVESDGTVYDLSGAARNLTENGTVTYLQDGPPGLVTAVAFSGSTSNYLDSASAAFGTTAPGSNASVSVAGWFRTTALASIAVPVSKASLNNGWNLLFDPAGGGYFGFQTAQGAATAGTNTPLGEWDPAGLAGTWVFVTATYGSSRMRIYTGTERILPALRGQAAGYATITAGANNLRVGSGHAASDGNAYAYNGRIAGLGIYNVELTLAQILKIWRRGPQAVADTEVTSVGGTFVPLDPGLGTTNRLELRADHATTAPTLRIAAGWRPLYG